MLFGLILALGTAHAGHGHCREIRLAQDDISVVGTGISGIPDVSAVDRATTMRTREASEIVLKARRRDLGCVDFGDVRAFKYAYLEAGYAEVLFLVTVNDETVGETFTPDVTSLVLTGLRRGDSIEIHVYGTTEPPPLIADLSGPTVMKTELRSYVY